MIKRIVRTNPQLVDAALLFNALSEPSGGGLHGAYKGMKSWAKPIVNPVLQRFTKMAQDQNYNLQNQTQKEEQGLGKKILKSSLWPLVMGPRRLPGRLVGNALDQALFHAAEKGFDKKPKKN